MAQLGDERVRAAVADLAIAAYACEQHVDVLIGVVRALGGAQDERGLLVLTALATHPDAQVRGQVAGDLPMVIGDPPEESGIAALIALSADPELEVRDWASFGLGTQTDADSVRQALWARTDDPNLEARDEAVVALARRPDPRVGPLVRDLLTRQSVGALIFQAAAHLKDPSLLPLLRTFDTADSDVRSAIEACECEQPALFPAGGSLGHDGLADSAVWADRRSPPLTDPPMTATHRFAFWCVRPTLISCAKIEPFARLRCSCFCQWP